MQSRMSLGFSITCNPQKKSPMQSPDIISIEKLLLHENIVIPSYQRPYKWTLKNIAQLFQDLRTHQNRSAYRLGTLVFHRNGKGELEIVDGQQRTLTLFLIAWAVSEKPAKNLDKALQGRLAALKGAVDGFMRRQRFPSILSQKNLLANYLEIKRMVLHGDFGEAQIEFFLKKCEVVVFVLHDLSEAFQFFDSQNARGRDLSPHDLLKAFHLREFSPNDSHLKPQSVAHWEGLENEALQHLFAAYLYRIRQWSKGESARYFGKEDVGLFKGINLDHGSRHPHAEILRISHHFVDEYNAQYQRKIDGGKMGFPFQIDQMIVNGRRFFEMAEHYQRTVQQTESPSWSPATGRIFEAINNYPERHRQGDRYVRSMFNCALIFYMDKFGTQELAHAVEKIFVWAYTCRIRHHVVQLATMDNYVLGNNMFARIRNLTSPHDVLLISLKVIQPSESKSNSEALVKIFKDMNYHA